MAPAWPFVAENTKWRGMDYKVDMEGVSRATRRSHQERESSFWNADSDYFVGIPNPESEEPDIRYLIFVMK